MLRDSGEAVEADLLRYYGVDLLDVYRGRLSLRRVRALVAHLPLGSATVAALQGAPEDWSTTDYLLADLFAPVTGKPHPSRPTIRATRSNALAEALRAQRERRAR